MRLISSLQITQSDGSAIELIDNGAELDLLASDETGLVIGGTGITNGAGLQKSFVYLSQDQVDSIKANKSVAGLGLGDSWTSTPTLYSSYDNHGTPEYVYRLAEGINLRTVLTALGADVASAPVAIEATATDGYTAIVSDAFSYNVSRNYIAPDGTVGPVVDPILIFYDDKVTTSIPDSSLALPTTTAAITDANPLFAYGQTERTEETNCKFVKNTNKIRAGKVDPAFTITQDSNTKSISVSDVARIGIYETAYSWNNSGTLVTQSVTGVPLSVLLTKLGVAVPSNTDLIIKVNNGSGSVASNRSISSSEISRCFVAFDAFADSERSVRVSGSLTPLRIYCPGQTEDSVLIENVVGASVDELSQTYTVSFEENGGTAVASITGVSGATIDTEPVTTKDGCEFGGWYTDTDLTNLVVFPYTISDNVKFYAKWIAEDVVGDREPGGDINNSVFYIALKDASGETKYYYYTKAELETYETQEAYTYDDHSVIKTVTCKGALLTDLLNDLKGVAITDDMVVQYAEEDGYHADAATAVIDSNYKDTIESLTKSTVAGSGSTKNPLRPIVTYEIHEEYANPDAYNVNDPAGVFKDADNNSGYLRVYRDTGGANSAVMKYMMGVVISPDGTLLSGKKGCVVTSVSDKNPTLKVRDDITIKGLLPGMQYAVKAPAVTNAALAAGQTSPQLITVGSGVPADQTVTFQYTEDTYFYVNNAISKTTTNYTYTDLMAMSEQVPDAGSNTPPYGYSRPMYYRYNGAWLSDLVSGLSGNYTIKLVAKDGTKTDITNNIADYFAAYNNTQSKTSTNIPEGKRVTVTYNDAKIIIPGTGENVTGSATDDYTTDGKDVDVLMAAAEGLEITATDGGGEATTATAQDDSVTMASGNQTVSSEDNTWVLTISEGTLRDALTADDIGFTGLPQGLTVTAIRQGTNNIVITVSGTAEAPLSSSLNIGAKVLKSAFTETEATDTNIVNLKLLQISDCFIATAAFGSYLDSHVIVLRNFRDTILLKSNLGRWFVSEYYQHSPAIASIIRANPILKWVTRVLLTPIIFGIEYPLQFIGVFIGLLGICILMRRKRIGVKTI